jgi:hypothetical protein
VTLARPVARSTAIGPAPPRSSLAPSSKLSESSEGR